MIVQMDVTPSFRHVEETGEALTATSHGKPTPRVVPTETKKSVDEIFAGIRKVVKNFLEQNLIKALSQTIEERIGRMLPCSPSGLWTDCG